MLLSTILAAFALTGCVSEIDSKPHPELHPYAEKDSGGDTEDSSDTADSSDTSTDPHDVDDDGDGWTENEGDCDDADEGTSPERAEINGNTTDENCDGGTHRFAWKNGISLNTEGQYILSFLMVDDNFGTYRRPETGDFPDTNNFGFIMTFVDTNHAPAYTMESSHCGPGAVCTEGQDYSIISESGTGSSGDVPIVEGYAGDPDTVVFVYYWNESNAVNYGCSIWGNVTEANPNGNEVLQNGAQAMIADSYGSRGRGECTLHDNPSNW